MLYYSEGGKEDKEITWIGDYNQLSFLEQWSIVKIFQNWTIFTAEDSIKNV